MFISNGTLDADRGGDAIMIKEHKMKERATRYEVVQYFLEDDGTFPNNAKPALHYKKVLDLPPVFSAAYVKRLFRHNGWNNAWVYGIYEYPHYHSITHEVLGFLKGETRIQLGGETGAVVTVQRGDVLIIPAGVAHCNLGKEKQVSCVGAYPDGRDYDMNYGKAGERPRADRNIAGVPVPEKDPVFGTRAGIVKYW